MGGDGQVVQVIAAQGGVRVEQTDLSELPAAQRQEQLEQAAAAVHRQPFDLQAGPLLRVGLIRESAEAHLLVVAMHHIVSDGRSEEHTSELQSPCNLVCRLLLEKKKYSVLIAQYGCWPLA